MVDCSDGFFALLLTIFRIPGHIHFPMQEEKIRSADGHSLSYRFVTLPDWNEGQPTRSLECSFGSDFMFIVLFHSRKGSLN